MSRKFLFISLLVVLIATLAVVNVDAQGPKPKVSATNVSTAFTYQGQLKKNGTLVTSTCNFQFNLWADAGGTIPVGSNPQTVNGVSVVNGLFTVPINFGSGAFTGDARWLGTAVQCAGDSGLTALNSLEALTPAPIALSLPGLATFQNGNGAQLDASGYGFVETDGTISAGTYVGGGGGWFGTKSNHPLYFFTNNNSPQVTLLQNGKLGIGTTTPADPLDVYTTGGGYGFVQSNGAGIAVGTYVGSGASGEIGGWFGTKSNHNLYFFTNNGGAQMTLERSTGNLGIGTISPVAKLDVNGDASINGPLNATFVSLALTSGGTQTICINSNGANGTVAQCSSSRRYKNNIVDLTLGLDAIAKLRPVTFDWKNNGEHDLGFVAEEVNQVTPLLTTLNKDGQIEGVKYDRITAVLVKGMQEQQQQIADLKKQNESLQTRLDTLEHSEPTRASRRARAQSHCSTRTPMVWAH